MRGTLTIAGMVLVVGLSACGDGEPADGSAATSSVTQSDAGGGEPVRIVVRYDLPSGEVLPASRIGDSPFCAGGTTSDEHGGTGDLGLVVSTFSCPDGELVITFSPTQHSWKQSSAWRVVEGSGSFDGAQGQGDMASSFDKHHPGQGQATFTGSIVP